MRKGGRIPRRESRVRGVPTGLAVEPQVLAHDAGQVLAPAGAFTRASPTTPFRRAPTILRPTQIRVYVQLSMCPSRYGITP